VKINTEKFALAIMSCFNSTPQFSFDCKL